MAQVDFARYRKFVVAAAGAVVLIGGQLLGLDFEENVGDATVNVYDAVVILLTAVGVRQVRNDPA